MKLAFLPINTNKLPAETKKRHKKEVPSCVTIILSIL